MKLHACQNCWFNGLQYGALGLSVGYCARHKKILNIPDGTTCRHHLRKDLTANRAKEVSEFHQKKYQSEFIVRISGEDNHKSDVSDNERDLELLKKDSVAEAVTDYGLLGTTIESLAQLKAIPGARAELGMLSLGRGYVSNCISNNGKWTSGLHLYWWSRKRLSEIPQIRIEDIRGVGSIQLSRQIDLTTWSLVMLRLTLVDDIVGYASEQGDPLGKVKSLTEQAALSLDTFNLKSLTRWIRNEAEPQLDAHLPFKRYTELANELNTGRSSAKAGK